MEKTFTKFIEEFIKLNFFKDYTLMNLKRGDSNLLVVFEKNYKRDILGHLGEMPLLSDSLYVFSVNSSNFSLNVEKVSSEIPIVLDRFKYMEKRLVVGEIFKLPDSKAEEFILRS